MGYKTPRYKIYFKACHRCSEFYRTVYRTSKICPECRKGTWKEIKQAIKSIPSPYASIKSKKEDINQHGTKE